MLTALSTAQVHQRRGLATMPSRHFCAGAANKSTHASVKRANLSRCAGASKKLVRSDRGNKVARLSVRFEPQTQRLIADVFPLLPRHPELMGAATELVDELWSD